MDNSGSGSNFPDSGSGAVPENFENVTFCLEHVSAKVKDGQEDDVFIQGKLTIVERAYGIFIDWKPVDHDEGGWIFEGEAPNSSGSSAEIDSDLLNIDQNEVTRLQFSVDIKDLRSYQCIEPKNGVPSVKFICKDGTSYIPLFFRKGGLSDFVTNLQRYATLKRSAKDATLVLFTDERAEALEQSVNMLNLNSDFFSDEQIAAIRQLMREQDDMSKLRRFTDDTGFEVLTQLELPPRIEIYRETAVDVKTWNSFKDEQGRIKNVRNLKSLVFRGGLSKELRQEAWKYLLGYYHWDKTSAENAKWRKDRYDYYYKMKLQWLSFTEEQQNNFSDYRDRKALIEKDVARTDRNHSFFMSSQKQEADEASEGNLQKLNNILMTYCMYNFDLGYVQGMSDFLSPILVVMQDEADAFWCFVGLMNRVHKNFEMDQSTVKLRLMQLRDLVMVVNPRLANYFESHESEHMYFCFRWILVEFKREFGFEETMKLWEVLWTDLPCPNFLLLFCVAILDKQTGPIIENKFGLTEILKHINGLSMHIDLEEMLTSAEAIYHQLHASQNKLPRHICSILNLNPDGENNPETTEMKD
uniref:TBC1 domain family member 15 n=1 Tax=Steinernema glaseri TaxID=37863 RepID=A0A1I8A3B3_9BILA